MSRAVRVVLDPGHGGRDAGATGPNNLREADLTLELVRVAAGQLARYPVEVLLTREGDRDVELSERVALANNRGADLFVSVHCNAALNPGPRGFESYIHPAAGPCTHAFRQIIHRTLMLYLAPLGVPDRGMKKADFYVLRKTKCPAVLLECLFVTNPADGALLSHPAGRARLANEIAWAVAVATGLEG